MWWLIAGLLVLGAICGATIRLTIFIGVLIAATLVSLATTAAGGAGAMALIFILTVVTLQIGYGFGLILRALIRSRHPRIAAAIHGKPTLPASLGGKRR